MIMISSIISLSVDILSRECSAKYTPCFKVLLKSFSIPLLILIYCIVHVCIQFSIHPHQDSELPPVVHEEAKGPCHPLLGHPHLPELVIQI